MNTPEQSDKYYKAWRAKVIEHLGGKCVCCGTTERLETDHIDPTNKCLNIADRWTFTWERQLSEINKCQLLCYDCHKEKHKPQRMHGTYAMYTRGKCRCENCKEAYREYFRQYRKTHFRYT